MKSILLLSLGLAAIASPAFAAEPKKKSFKEIVFTRYFNEADADGNNILDAEEFAGSHGASQRPVITEIRFDRLASFIKSEARGLIVTPERGIFLEDFIDAHGGRKIRPSKSHIFWAADDNYDGFLSMSEFLATRIISASTEGTAAKAFERFDKNDDNLISPSEWGISTPV